MATSGKFIAGKRQKEFLKMIFKEGKVSLENLFNSFLESENRQLKYTQKRMVEDLSKRGIIKISGENVVLSKEGLRLLNFIEITEINISKTNWDGIWRVVTYDIPIGFNKERDYFRKKIKELGFVNIQKSLWVVPYECKEEISIFAHSLKIAPYIFFIETKKLPILFETKLRKIFDLKMV